MEKILIIARSPAPAISDELKMGSKTIVILRERAILRAPLSSSSSLSESTS